MNHTTHNTMRMALCYYYFYVQANMVFYPTVSGSDFLPKHPYNSLPTINIILFCNIFFRWPHLPSPFIIGYEEYLDMDGVRL